MPLEIRELIIKVAVNENADPANIDNTFLEHKIAQMKSQVVKECIEKIKAEIQQQNKR